MNYISLLFRYKESVNNSKVCQEGQEIRLSAPEVVVEEDQVNQTVVQDHWLLGGDQGGEDLANALQVLLVAIVASQIRSSSAVLGLEVKTVLHKEPGQGEIVMGRKSYHLGLVLSYMANIGGVFVREYPICLYRYFQICFIACMTLEMCRKESINR